MAEELRGLIEKIQTEGIQAAEKKAAEIIEEARTKAAAAEEQAKESAARLTADANDGIKRHEAAVRASLEQAARDTVLTLKKNITALLDAIIRTHVQKTMTGDEMARMITGLVKGTAAGKRDDIVISLAADDEKALRKTLLAELGEAAARGIALKGSPDIRGGFLISFDKGSSSYDVTDRALAEYLATVVKPELAELLRKALPAE